ncbi:hypothetical protein HOY80DRAFT_477951 [Tuber brumale]|nr:hypothetical protein HOY80DRAFT_477951 [Tuber brumale]
MSCMRTARQENIITLVFADRPNPNYFLFKNKMPKDPTTGKRREATLVERVKVIEKHAAGKSYRTIGEEIGISKSEAQRIIQRWKEFEELKPRPRTGRPSKYPPGETRAERRKKLRIAQKLADAEKAKAGTTGEVEGSAVGGNSVQVPIVSLTVPVDGHDPCDGVPDSAVEPPSSAVEPPSSAVEPPSSAVEPPSSTVEPPSSAVEPGEGTREDESLNEGEGSGGEGNNEVEDGAMNPLAESEETTNQNPPTESAQ